MTNQWLARLAAAQTEEERSWLITEGLIETFSPELASAVWAVAIPHWFNAEILAVLCPELAAEAKQLYTNLQALPFVEVFPERGHDIHERTRRLILNHLWQENSIEFRVLSTRAAAYFAQSSRPEDQIEWLYHLVVVDTKWEGDELWHLAQQWHNDFRRAELESLNKVLLEQVQANRVESPAKAEIFYWQGRAKFRVYQAAEAVEHYRTALGFYRDIGDRLGEANTLKAIGDVLQFFDHHTEALEHYEPALGFYRDIGDRLGEANTLKATSDVLQFLNHRTAALERYETALGFYRDIGDRLGEANTLKAIGDVLQFLNHRTAALERYETALGFYRDIGDRLGEANTLKAIGDVLQFLNRRTSRYGRFFKRLIPYRGILFESLLINLVLGGLSLASPFLIQILIDDVLIRADTHLLEGLAIAIIVMTIVSSALSVVQANLITQFTQRLELELVMEFGRKILRLPLGYYEARRSGDIIRHLQDIQRINQLVSQSVISLPSQFFIALSSLGLMVFYSWKLVLVVLVLAIASSISTILFIPVLQQKVRSMMVLDAENQGVLVEIFKGALTLKTTTAQQQFWEELQSRFSRLSKLVYSTAQIGIINGTFSSLVSGVGGVVLLWFGSSLVIERELSIGQLLAFNSMSGNFLGFVGAVIGFVDEFMQVKTAAQDLSEVIDTTSESDEADSKALVQIQDDADITLSDLVFHHRGGSDLLDHFSLTIPGGKTTVVIGRSGSGKSSLVKLISGLYPYQSGNIQIGVFNLQDLALDCLRQQVVLVPQEPHFWSRSIAENFFLGSPNVTFEEIICACQMVGADKFISQLPHKYETILGEFGANLSRGQRQRLAVARAIINNPPVLILDESTAGLDPISEAEILDRLLAYRGGKTTIMISYRPRVIERAEWIVFLAEGKVKAQGTLGDLRSENGDHMNFLNP